MSFDAEGFEGKLQALKAPGAPAQTLGRYLLFKEAYIADAAQVWQDVVAAAPDDANVVGALLEVVGSACGMARRRGKSAMVSILERALRQALVRFTPEGGMSDETQEIVKTLLRRWQADNSGPGAELITLLLDVMEGRSDVTALMFVMDEDEEEEEGVEADDGGLGGDGGSGSGGLQKPERWMFGDGLGVSGSPLRACVSFLAEERARANPRMHEEGEWSGAEGTIAWEEVIGRLPDAGDVVPDISAALDALLDVRDANAALADVTSTPIGRKRSRTSTSTSTTSTAIQPPPHFLAQDAATVATWMDECVVEEEGEGNVELDVDHMRRILKEKLEAHQAQAKAHRRVAAALQRIGLSKDEIIAKETRRREAATTAIKQVAASRSAALRFAVSHHMQGAEEALSLPWSIQDHKPASSTPTTSPEDPFGLGD